MYAQVTLIVVAALLCSLPSAASARTLRLSPLVVLGVGGTPADGATSAEEEEIPALLPPAQGPTEGETPAHLEGAGAAQAVVEAPQSPPPPLLTDEGEIEAAQALLEPRLLRFYERRPGEHPWCCARLVPGGRERLSAAEVSAALGARGGEVEDYMTLRASWMRLLEAEKRGSDSQALALGVTILGVILPFMLGDTGSISGFFSAYLSAIVLAGGGGLYFLFSSLSHSTRRRALIAELGFPDRQTLKRRFAQSEAALKELLREYNDRQAASLGLPSPGALPAVGWRARGGPSKAPAPSP